MAVISVIIPVYNSKSYLDCCLESVISQTFKDLEIIIVNDGSSDGSKEICEKYAKKDSRIKLINQENQGVSAARNKGLDVAQGEYIGFLDSDDFIKHDMYEKLYKLITENKADISVCAVEEIDAYGEKKISNKDSKYKTFIFDTKEAVECILSGKFLTMYSVNKLYRRELFENIRYKIGVIYEDTILSTQIFAKSKKVVYNSQVLYYYVRNPDSITLQKFSSKDMDIIDSGEYVSKFIEERIPSLKKAAEYRKFWSYLHVLDRIILSGMDRSDYRYRKIMYFIKNNGVNMLLNPYFSFKRKAGILTIIFSESIYRKIILSKFNS